VTTSGTLCRAYGSILFLCNGPFIDANNKWMRDRGKAV
jgi:hypothetical protein